MQNVTNEVSYLVTRVNYLAGCFNTTHHARSGEPIWNGPTDLKLLWKLAEQVAKYGGAKVIVKEA